MAHDGDDNDGNALCFQNPETSKKPECMQHEKLANDNVDIMPTLEPISSSAIITSTEIVEAVPLLPTELLQHGNVNVLNKLARLYLILCEIVKHISDVENMNVNQVRV